MRAFVPISRATGLLASAMLSACGGGESGPPSLPVSGSRILVVQQQPPSQLLAFPLITAGSGPNAIAIGSDSNYWATEGSVGKIARVTNAGAVSEYSYHLSRSPSWITTGGGVPFAIWTIDTTNSVLSGVTPAGAPTEHALPPGSSPLTVFDDASGFIWMTEPAKNAVVETTNPSVPSPKYTTFSLPAGSAPSSIVQGPDKNLWVTEPGTGAIAKIAHAGGAVTQYPLRTGRTPTTIIVMGAYLWFGEAAPAGTSYLARMTTAGAITEFAVPGGSTPQFLVAGPLSAVWYCTSSGQLAYAVIGTKVIFQPAVASLGSAVPIVQGKDANIWLPDPAHNSVDVYVVNPMTVTSSSIAFTAITQSQSFSVSETHFTGNFNATTSNAGVASVSPTSGHAFTVTANAPGTATITVSDNSSFPKLGNGTTISVTVTTTSISLN